MANTDSKLGQCIKKEGSLYFVQTLEAKKLAERMYLLAVIEHRYGHSAKRMWNMLNMDGQMEQRAIASEAMIQNSEARELLYAMLRNGWVLLSDIIKIDCIWSTCEK